MDKYLSCLGEYKVPQRYKSQFEEKDVSSMIKATYKWYLTQRGVKEVKDMSLYFDKAAKWLCGDYKSGLLLYGTIGSGKSTLMESMIKVLVITHTKLKIGKYSAIDITKKFQIGESEDVFSKEVLFIDDLGEESLTVKNYGNEQSPLIEVLYKRYDKRQFTVITTNKSEEEIQQMYGERIADRFKEMFDRVFFGHQSFRK